ncbi:hypothetical protein HPP92_017311 [Vanilla planifolia]|uniref:Uncharacterized protein n=1 Tax=Vanilla planifolia TaxID=51239 RepID=A0A835QAW4_VANPL|nr:hypothetical protein HPP92_017311 [Vanilla planifolia]
MLSSPRIVEAELQGPRQASAKERSAMVERPEKMRWQRRRSLGKRIRNATFTAFTHRQISSSSSAHGVAWISSAAAARWRIPSREMLSSMKSLRARL